MSDYDYDGWAPCIHNEEDRVQARVFLAERKSHDYTPFDEMENKPWTTFNGGDLECMIWQLTDLTGRGDIQFDCDQWWGVFVTGSIRIKDVGPKHFKTRVQADTLLLGVAETLRWWAEKYKELRPDG